MTRLGLWFRRLRLRVATWWALRGLGLRVGDEARLVLDPERKPLDRPTWLGLTGSARVTKRTTDRLPRHWWPLEALAEWPDKPVALACTVRGFVGQSVDIECMGRRLRVAPCRLEGGR